MIKRWVRIKAPCSSSFCKHSIISKHFIRTAELVYNHINEHKHFHALESSRHFGPMVFFLCWNRQVQKSELVYDTTSGILVSSIGSQKTFHIKIKNLPNKKHSFLLMLNNNMVLNILSWGLCSPRIPLQKCL